MTTPADKRRVERISPWDLTQREVDTMRAVLKTGCNKLAADVLNVSEKTIEFHAAAASRQMKAISGFRHRLHCLIAFHDWDKSQVQSAAVQMQRFDEAGERI